MQEPFVLTLIRLLHKPLLPRKTEAFTTEGAENAEDSIDISIPDLSDLCALHKIRPVPSPVRIKSQQSLRLPVPAGGQALCELCEFGGNVLEPRI